MLATDLITKRKQCNSWLSKLESVNRERQIYVMNYGIGRVSSFKLLVLCYSTSVSLYLLYLYLFLKLLFLTAMFKFYSSESSIFSKIYIYKDREIVFFFKVQVIWHLTEQSVFFSIKVFSKQLLFGKLHKETSEIFLSSNFIKLDF